MPSAACLLQAGAYLSGEWLHHQKPTCLRATHRQVKLKKHGRKEISVFRYGFDHLRDMLLNINEKYHEFKKMVRLLRRCLISGPPGFARMDEKRNRQYILNHVRDTIDLPAAA